MFAYQTYHWYQNNYTDILLELEQKVSQITLPIKVAMLYTQDPVTELPIPVQGINRSQITDTWGAPRPTGRGHNGVDIFAERGTLIFSATTGYVTRMGVGELGGNYVFITGPGGVRYYYAHLNAISPNIAIGDEVNTETILGYVGNTGNAITTPPHLHFGMYQNGAQNPYPLLIDR